MPVMFPGNNAYTPSPKTGHVPQDNLEVKYMVLL